MNEVRSPTKTRVKLLGTRLSRDAKFSRQLAIAGTRLRRYARSPVLSTDHDKWELMILRKILRDWPWRIAQINLDQLLNWTNFSTIMAPYALSLTPLTILIAGLIPC